MARGVVPEGRCRAGCGMRSMTGSVGTATPGSAAGTAAGSLRRPNATGSSLETAAVCPSGRLPVYFPVRRSTTGARMTDTTLAAQPLTVLSEEEQMFRAGGARVRRVRGAPPRPRDGRGGEVRPGPAPRSSSSMGLMGIEVPEAVRRRGRQHLHGEPRHRGAGPGGRLGGDLRGRAEHPGQQLPCSAGATRSRSAATSPGWRPTCSAPSRSREPASGSDAFALETRAEDKGTTGS